MERDDLEPVRKRTNEVDQDLSMLSVDELRARIDLLKQEIARLEEDIAAKQSSRAAADSVFKL